MKNLQKGLLQLLLAGLLGASACAHANDTQRAGFIKAWQAAARGDRSGLQAGMSQLQSYLLVPYLEYEDLRQGRRRVKPTRINSFLQQYQDWAFAGRLQVTWLRTLGRQKRWAEFLDSYEDVADTEVRCHYVSARVKQNLPDGLRPEVEKLWLHAKSQHKSCDPAFKWLVATHGISPDLARQRIELAIGAGQVRFSRYLERFLPADERAWPDRWRRLRANPSRTANEAKQWPDGPFSQTIVSKTVQYLARRDISVAERLWQQLEPHH